MNALVDALSEYGISHIDMPATPERVWQAIRDAQKVASLMIRALAAIAFSLALVPPAGAA